MKKKTTSASKCKSEISELKHIIQRQASVIEYERQQSAMEIHRLENEVDNAESERDAAKEGCVKLEIEREKIMRKLLQNRLLETEIVRLSASVDEIKSILAPAKQVMESIKKEGIDL